MLEKCPECELPVSNKAIYCPHCGYPFKLENRKYYPRSKRKRLPNGFGQISEIKGRNLRKPFRAMITVGKTENGKPISKLLKPEAYFKTYNEAYEALMEFNKNPYDPTQNMTMEALYKKWSKDRFPALSAKSVSGYEHVWNAFCSLIYDLDVREVKISHVKTCMSLTSGQTSKRVKSLIAQLLDYAMEYEYIDKNVARNFKLPDSVKVECETKKSHKAFTDDEMNMIWNRVGEIGADMILVQCYSGWRPGELCQLRTEDIDLEKWTFKGGLKTKASKNRVVPIHPRIREIVMRYYNPDRKYLFNVTYDHYRSKFSKVTKGHAPHDGRKHFVTMAKNSEVDEYAIKYIVGHTISDITEKVYTERSIDWLAEEMQKIR